MNRQSFWQGSAALVGFWLVLAGCQPEDPYQDASNPPVAADTAATAQVQQQDGDANTNVPGAESSLPLAERAAGAEDAWNQATEADYQTAIADCQNLSGVPREDCIEQVELGFHAARTGAQNPDEAQRIAEDAGLDDNAATASTDDDDE